MTFPFHSCKYEPVGEYDRNANQNADPPSIQIVDLNLNTDTIIVYNEKGVKFKFDTQYHNVLGVRLLIDTTEIGKVNGGTGEIMIEKWKVAVGVHDLKLQVYTGSGTGSIADSIRLEGYLFCFGAQPFRSLENKDYILHYPDSEKPIKPDWKGFRLGVAVYVNFSD